MFVESRLRNTKNWVLLGDASFEKDSEGIIVMITAASLMRCVPPQLEEFIPERERCGLQTSFAHTDVVFLHEPGAGAA